MAGLSNRIKISAIILIAFALRLYRLGEYDYWFDEILCVFQRNNISEILSGRILDSNPPLYFLILNFWGRFSESEFWMRLPSVLFAIITILLVYSFTKKIIGDKSALAASFILAISPFHIYYSQEVKMYSLFILLSFISFSSLVMALEEGDKKYFISYSIATALALYTHYFAIYMLCVEAGAVILFLIFSKAEKKTLKRLALALASVALIYMPWLPIMLREHFFNTSGFVTTWIPKPGIKTFFYTLKNFSVGFSSPRINYFPASIAYFFMATAGIIQFIKSRGRGALLIIAFVLLAPLGLFVASIKSPVYLDRYISFTLPFFIIILSASFINLKGRTVGAICILLSLFSFFGYRDMYEKIPFINQAPGEHERVSMKEPVEYIKSRWEKGDIVGHSCRSTQLSFEYYWGDDSPEQKLVAVEKFEKYPQPAYWPHSSLLPQVVPDALKGGDKIWLVLSWWDPMDKLDYISVKLKKWMDEHFYLSGEKRFPGIFVYEYERSAGA